MGVKFNDSAGQGYDLAAFAGLRLGADALALAADDAPSADELAQFLANPSALRTQIVEGRQINPDQIAGFMVPGAASTYEALLAALKEKEEEEREALDQQLDNLRRRIAQLDAEIAAIEERLTEIDTTIKTLKTREEKLRDVQKRLEEDPGLASNPAFLKELSALGITPDEIKRYGGDAGRAIESEITQTGDEITRLETERDRLRKELAAKKAELAKLQAEIDRLEAEKADAQGLKTKRNGVADAASTLESTALAETERKLFDKRIERAMENKDPLIRDAAIDAAARELSGESLRNALKTEARPEVLARLKIEKFRRNAASATQELNGDPAAQAEITHALVESLDEETKAAILADPDAPDEWKDAILSPEDQVARFEKEAARIRARTDLTEAQKDRVTADHARALSAEAKEVAQSSSMSVNDRLMIGLEGMIEEMGADILGMDFGSPRPAKPAAPRA